MCSLHRCVTRCGEIPYQLCSAILSYKLLSSLIAKLFIHYRDPNNGIIKEEDLHNQVTSCNLLNMPGSGHFSGIETNHIRDRVNEAEGYWNNLYEAQPKLTIVTQPACSFRFRYESEKPGSHGTLSGEKHENAKKAYPTVKVENIHGPVIIKASLVTHDKDHKPHVHELVGQPCSNGICEIKIEENDPEMKAVFQNMVIEHKGKKEVPGIILSRFIKLECKGLKKSESDLPQVVLKKLKERAERKAKSFNLNFVCIRFDATIPNSSISIEPVFSNLIRNLKSAKSGELKICRIDKSSGVCSGQEEVFLLCEKVQKDDIEVIFYENDANRERIWEAKARFNEHDVHRQFAIVFKTLPYRDENLTEPVDVLVMLHRPSDEMCSASVPFKYKPRDDYIGTQKKRLRPNQDSFEDSLNRNQTRPYPDDQLQPGNYSTQSFISETNASNFPHHAPFSHQDISSICLLDTDPLLSQSIAPYLSDDRLYEDFNLRCDGLAVREKAKRNSNVQLKLPDSKKSFQVSQEQEPIQHSNISIEVRNQVSLLNQFAKTGHVSKLLKIFDKIIGVEDLNGNNAIMQAIIHQNFNGAILMIENAFDFVDGKVISHHNRLKQTALHLAVMMENSMIVSILLDKKCKTEKIDRNGDSAFHLAAKVKSKQCLSILCAYAKSNQMLGNIIDLKNNNGMTPLHLAVISSNLECIDTLLSHGANVNFADGKCGKRPLHLAVENSDLVAAKTLLKKKEIDVNLQTFNGDTALHYAVLKLDINKEIVSALLHHGADPLRCNCDSQNENGHEGISAADLVGGITELTKYVTREQIGDLEKFCDLSIDIKHKQKDPGKNN